MISYRCRRTLQVYTKRLIFIARKTVSATAMAIFIFEYNILFAFVQPLKSFTTSYNVIYIYILRAGTHYLLKLQFTSYYSIHLFIIYLGEFIIILLFLLVYFFTAFNQFKQLFYHCPRIDCFTIRKTRLVQTQSNKSYKEIIQKIILILF